MQQDTLTDAHPLGLVSPVSIGLPSPLIQVILPLPSVKQRFIPTPCKGLVESKLPKLNSSEAPYTGNRLNACDRSPGPAPHSFWFKSFRHFILPRIRIKR